MYYCFSTITIKTKWDVLDIYKNIVYSDTLLLKSSEKLEDGSLTDADLLKEHISNAMETGLYTIMNTPGFRNTAAIDKSISISNQTSEIKIRKPEKFATSLEEAVEATVTIKTNKGHGSGFLITQDGFLITNYHVVKDSSKIEVILNDDTKYLAKVLTINKEADLALLKIEKSIPKPLLISENSSLNIGKEVFAIGTPEAADLSQTLSKGIISSVRNQANGLKLLQTDISINSGNSGGPLVDLNGNLMGVVNSKIVGIGTEGISFAIPANTILQSLNIIFN